MDRELTLKEVIEKHQDVSPFIIIKIDVQRRTVVYTEKALNAADKDLHLLQSRSIFTSIGEKNDPLPVALLLRDGTSILTSPLPNAKNPYIVDEIDGKLYLTDRGEIIEEAAYSSKPDFHDKLTSSGKPMWQIVLARPQRLDIDPYSYCHFWDKGDGCRYCNMGANFRKSHKEFHKPARLDAQDVYETVREALKQPGRLTLIKMTAGSLLGGPTVFDDEVDLYIEMLQAVGRNFKTKRFPSQLITSAYDEKQLARLYENTGVMSYTSDMEVLNEEKFSWICPGKQKAVGYREWKRRLIAAVDIFGKGYVNTGIVGGVELAKPYGFRDEQEGLAVTLAEAEDFASQGVSVVCSVWVPYPGSAFQHQSSPSLDYYVRLAKGLRDIRSRYKLDIHMDDYRRCGNHPDSDLSRVL